MILKDIIDTIKKHEIICVADKDFQKLFYFRKGDYSNPSDFLSADYLFCEVISCLEHCQDYVFSSQNVTLVQIDLPCKADFIEEV